MAEHHRVRIERLILSGIPREQQAAAIAEFKKALHAGLAEAGTINPQAAHTPLDLSIGAPAGGKAIGAAAGRAIARTVAGDARGKGHE